MIEIKTYYIKQGKERIFKKIELNENVCEILKTLKNETIIANVINQILKNDIYLVILSKELLQNEKLVDMLKYNKIKIFDGMWLYKYLISDIIEFICKRGKVDVNEEIAILTNDLTEEFLGNIEILSKKFKKIKIITEYPDKFRKIDKKILENLGFSMVISQNRKQALTKSKILINFDLTEDIINEYNINENAIILSLDNKITINKKRFNGIIVKDYEIEYDQITELDFINSNDFYFKHIKESQIYEKSLKERKLEEANLSQFDIVRRIIEEEKIKIKELYGKNGCVL